MGTLSAEQWGCQAWLLLSKSSSRARWGAQILQSNRRLLLEPAGDVMQLVGKGGQPIRCRPWPVSPVQACRRAGVQPGSSRQNSSGRGFRTLSVRTGDSRTWDWFLEAQEPVCSGHGKPWGLLDPIANGSRSQCERSSLLGRHRVLLKSHTSSQDDLSLSKPVGGSLTYRSIT